jgi:hypothetical protein
MFFSIECFLLPLSLLNGAFLRDFVLSFQLLEKLLLERFKNLLMDKSNEGGQGNLILGLARNVIFEGKCQTL